MGLILGRSFKDFDYKIQQTEGFNQLGTTGQYLVKVALNFFHHFWIGLLLMVYFPHILEVYWFGYGLLLDDAPDIPPRFMKYFKYLFEG